MVRHVNEFACFVRKKSNFDLLRHSVSIQLHTQFRFSRMYKDLPLHERPRTPRIHEEEMRVREMLWLPA